MKHIFIVNPAAGVGASEKQYLPNIIQFLKDTGVDYEIHRTLNKQEVGTWIKQRVQQGDPVRFYAIGGDGTICDVVNGIVGHPNAEFAVIPCGSGNDFVKNFTNLENFLSLEKQIAGKAVPIDLLKYNDSYSVNMLNIGADCDIVVASEEMRRSRKIGGAASYAISALQILPKHPTYRMVYTIDGVEYEDDIMLIAIGNGKFCGGGFKSCPTGNLHDGKMDIGIVRPVVGPQLFPLLWKYHQGTHIYDKKAAPYLKYLQVEKFDLRALDPCVVSVDGEVFPFEPTHFEVVRNAVKFVIPEGSEMIE